MVKIAPAARCHNGLVFFFGCMYTAFFASPAHYQGIGCKTAFQYLVPANNFPAFAVYEFFHALYKIALQFVFVFQTFLTHQLLAYAVFLPPYLTAFVATNMYHLAWEQFYHFGQYIFQEFERGFCRCKHIVLFSVQSPCHGHFGFYIGCCAEFRISSQCRHAVAGHFNFGQHGNVSVCCVSHNLLYLFLCVVAAMTCTVVARAGKAANNSTVTPCTNGCEFGIFFYFYTPALVIGQVPMEVIHFMQCNVVDVFFYIAYGKEVAAHIQVHTTIGKAGLVFYLHTRHQQFGSLWFFYRQQLYQGLHAVESACPAVALYAYVFGRYTKGISFFIVGFAYKSGCGQADIIGKWLLAYRF